MDLTSPRGNWLMKEERLATPSAVQRLHVPSVVGIPALKAGPETMRTSSVREGCSPCQGLWRHVIRMVIVGPHFIPTFVL